MGGGGWTRGPRGPGPAGHDQTLQSPPENSSHGHTVPQHGGCPGPLPPRYRYQGPLSTLVPGSSSHKFLLVYPSCPCQPIRLLVMPVQPRPFLSPLYVLGSRHPPQSPQCPPGFPTFPRAPPSSVSHPAPPRSFLSPTFLIQPSLGIGMPRPCWCPLDPCVPMVPRRSWPEPTVLIRGAPGHVPQHQHPPTQHCRQLPQGPPGGKDCGGHICPHGDLAHRLTLSAAPSHRPRGQ